MTSIDLGTTGDQLVGFVPVGFSLEDKTDLFFADN